MIEITSLGAAGEVTGSKHLLQIKGYNILLDCGMFQGKRVEANRKNRSFSLEKNPIDALVLSHAHIDHSGLVPKLVQEGYRGPIYCTSATKALLDPMLFDSAQIQVNDATYYAHKQIESPLPIEPLYTEEDVHQSLQLMKGIEYHSPQEILPGIKLEFLEAGHVFGSAMIYISWEEEGKEKICIFTGDLGRENMPIIRDPDQLKKADILILESTYGNRLHQRVELVENDLAEIINTTFRRGGRVYIPAFALERTQELLLRIEKLQTEKKIPTFPIYIDSPLAGKFTRVFSQFNTYYDQELSQYYQKHGDPFSRSNFRFTESIEESKELNFLKGPAIVISGSGMAESGRIRHHLKRNIEDPANSIVFVGYQAEDTLGRKLIEGHKEISIFRKRFQVKAQIHQLKSMSGHADQHDLIKMVKSLDSLQHLILVHGEDDSRQRLAEKIREELPNLKISLPFREESMRFDI